MLCISRKSGESFEIRVPSGELIVVSVQRVDHGRCRLGIEAPPQVRIVRSELVELDRKRAGEDAE